ncbi:MAG: AI-2E family transporter [Pseudomonadota bacterium]|nr:AI-2E family transporter [Pseudomonadota bacterium]
MLRDRTLFSRYTVAAWVLTGVALIVVLQLHLLPALLAGMLVYQLVHVIAPTLNKHLSDKRAKVIAVGLLSALVVILVMAAIIGAITFFKSDAGSLSALLARMAEIIDSSRATMPNWIVEQIPARPEDLKATLAEWLRTHAADVQSMGKEVGRIVVQTLIGMVLGAMVALHEALPIEASRPLSQELVERVRRLGDAFRRVVFAQVQISLINTLLTGIYLALVLPIFGVNLPLKKTLIVVTFITGLLPVIGNLISNVVIVVISLSYSLNVAIGSLLFLVVIHKLEYFLNARIIGRRIESRAWELLLAMLAMEAAFGISGVIAAPIYYAYLKDELKDRGLI